MNNSKGCRLKHCTVLIVNSLERFKAAFTPNYKRITSTKKKKKIVYASFIPKNCSGQFLSAYFLFWENLKLNLTFAACRKREKLAPEPAFLMVSIKNKRSLGDKIRKQQRNIQPSLSALFFPHSFYVSFVLFLFVDLWLNFCDHVKKCQKFHIQMLCCVTEGKSEDLNSMDRPTAI